MTKVLVKNPTGTAKAIRIKGGHEIIGRGKSSTVDISALSEEELSGLKAAGLLFGRSAKADDAADAAADAAEKAKKD